MSPSLPVALSLFHEASSAVGKKLVLLSDYSKTFPHSSKVLPILLPFSFS
jgi:hypothetical protein